VGISFSLKVGDMITIERTFLTEVIKLFTKDSGDEGSHHVTPEKQAIVRDIILVGVKHLKN
jgi:hypothetical protein